MKNQVKMIIGIVIGSWAMSGCVAVGALLLPMRPASRRR